MEEGVEEEENEEGVEVKQNRLEVEDVHEDEEEHPVLLACRPVDSYSLTRGV